MRPTAAWTSPEPSTALTTGRAVSRTDTESTPDAHDILVADLLVERRMVSEVTQVADR